jgi:Tfp pilus assembly protein PilF
MKGIEYLMLMMVISLMASCANTPAVSNPVTLNPVAAKLMPLVYEDAALFPQNVDVSSEQVLFQLSEKQQADFLSYFHLPINESVEPYMRVYDYLEKVTLDFSYRQATYVSSEALRRGRGNCLSLALLTTSLARLAEVEVGYQLVDSTPVFQKQSDLIIKGLHVRTKLFDGRQAVFGRSGIIVDYFPGGNRRFRGNLNSAEFVANYYLNLAADYLNKSEYVEAYWHARRALLYAPTNYRSLNSMAVIFRRAGDEDKAEEIYQYAISVAEEKLTLLKNYRLLLLAQNRVSEAGQVAARIATINDPNPYGWIGIGDESLKAGRYADAQKYYSRAIKLAPYLQYGYLGLARIYHEKEEFEKARKMLLLAIENNYNLSNNAMYVAKLAMLDSKQAIVH